MTPCDRDAITGTDHEVPDAPVALDLDDTEAPPWARKLYARIGGWMLEERASRARVERNQEIQIQETRRLARRVTDFESDLDRLRSRVESLEDSRDRLERAAEGAR